MTSTSQLSEYTAVRSHAGVWIREEAALVRITGADRYSWLQGMISNDVTLLTSESATRLPACVLDATGHLVSVITLTIPPDQPESLLMEAPALNRTSLLDTLDRYLITEDVEMAPVDLATITIQGVSAGEMAADICDGVGVAYYAADHTGSQGFDFYVLPDFAVRFVDEAVNQGAARISPEVRELLRIEAGIPVAGKELNASVIALEAGLGPTHVSLTKGCYVGQEIMARIDSRGHTNRALNGLVVTAGPAPSPADTITFVAEGADSPPRETGRVTSAASSSPAMQGRPIALGYVRHEHRTPGTLLHIGPHRTVAEVVELPFWRG